LRRIIAAQIGDGQKAIRMVAALLMDLADVGGTKDGCHIALMGGT
jgi:trehalose/maltose hydrolase-like predicted phosphorylase